MDRREMMTAVAATAGTALLPQISAARDRSKEGIQFDYEAIVVGGGPAGLSAALVLGRCCRKVLVCDAGEHRNRTSPSVHSFFSRDGISPSELLKIGRDQLKPYDVAFHQCRIVSARQLDKGFQVRADSGKSFTASKLILATGVKDDLPHINGLAELWGAGVYHCPYCHGWEVRGKPWAYMADQKLAVEWGIELKGWTDSLTYCSGGSSSLTNAERERLRQHGIGIREQAIERVTGEGGKIRGIDFSDGGVLDVDAFFIRAPMIPRSSLAKQLGCKLVFVPGVFSDTAETDPYGATSVAGVYVVGDASVGAPQVATAVTDGAMAAIMLNKSLFQEAPAHSSK